ncbi:Leukemia inhibitory factor receptor [Merluccius polli]|uniref:Leukemia inhibitory factor receptor n=1 Tax=Merluccius polli TaxID=89951 RepID=A0AA47N6S2_MERPO|nr:Leukemia inhibitory factor receptor [Merluccius polli]
MVVSNSDRLDSGVPLRSAPFHISAQCRGFLSVEPARVFLLGSDLTLHCHITDGRCSMGWFILGAMSALHHRCAAPPSQSPISLTQARLPLTLLVDGESVAPEKRINCTTARFRLTNVRRLKSIVKCVENKLTVCGLVLHGILPPDKPTDVVCEASWEASGPLACWWNQGQVTYQATTYNVSLTSANGTQIHDVRVQTNSFKVPQTLLDDNESYQLSIIASNPMGAAKSDRFKFCVKDVVVPETPLIVHIEFDNDSSTATVRCNSPESSEQLSYLVSLRTGSSSWLHRGVQSGTGLVRVEGLNALTEYEFKARACYSVQAGGLSTEPTSTSRSSPTSQVASSKRPRCSEWSQPELQVWRMLGHQDNRGLQNVTVLWKPPPAEDYSGGLQHYEVLLNHAESKVVTCPPAGSQCVIQVSPDIRTLHVSAVTSYGRSPPAAIYLKPSGVPGPAMKRPLPAGNGRVVLSWSWPPSGPGGSGVAGGLVGYVTEWTSGPGELLWNKESRHQNTTIIRGLDAGVRYKFSVYTVTTTGMSEPSSALVYSEEQIPLAYPNMSVVEHKADHILIQWEELPIIAQRGFITNYTVYLRTLSSNDWEQCISVSGSSPRRLWLDCPECSVMLVGRVTALVLTTALFLVAIAILISWRSLKKRIKQACISWGPSWLVENLPKPEDSKANTLLKRNDDDQTPAEPFCPTRHSDPPLSPIEEIPLEDREDRANLLPTQPGPFHPQMSWPRLTAEVEQTPSTEGTTETVNYKPHAVCMEEEDDEEKDRGEEEEGGAGQRDIPDTPAREQGSGCSVMLDIFQRTSLFYGVDGDLPNIVSLGLNEDSEGRISSVLCSGVFFGKFESEDQGTMCVGYKTLGE